MPEVQFGVVVPTESLKKSRRQHYIADVNHLLNYVKGHFASAWVVDHLQFEDRDVLEDLIREELCLIASRIPGRDKPS